VRELYWPIAKPYQPTSPSPQTWVIGSTGAVWLDGDGDGRRTSARGYAERLDRDAGGEWPKLVAALAGYDEAVALQAASLLQSRGVAAADVAGSAEAKRAGPHVERAFAAFAEAWRDSRIARAQAR